MNRKKQVVALLAAICLLLWPCGVSAEGEVPAADLTVTALSWQGGDGQVTPGTELTFCVEIANIGTADVTEPFTVDLAADGATLLQLTGSGVKAGETVVLASQPWPATEGDHMLSAWVNAGNTVSESNTVNNTRQINLRVADNRLAPTYDTVAEVVAEAGMSNLVFSDDFDSLSTVDTTAGGALGYKWYVTRPFGASTLTTDDYSVSDGVLSLHLAVPTYNYGLSTVDMGTRNGFTYNKGYLEMRIRIPQFNTEGEGIPAVWGMPQSKLHSEKEMWVEMDFLEYWGKKSDTDEKGSYSVTLHEQWLNEDYQVTDWYSSRGGGSLTEGEWHTLGFLWEENSLRCFLDGEAGFTQTWGEDEIPIPNNKVERGEIRFEGVFSYMNQQLLPLFISGSADNPLEIDYLRIWQTESPALTPTADTTAGTVRPWHIAAAAVGVAAIAAVAGIGIRRRAQRQTAV